MSRRVVFLPGAGGAAEFWRPVAERLPSDWRRTLLRWPGAGDEPHDADVRSFEDLIKYAAAAVDGRIEGGGADERVDDGRADVVAQSMGGVVAIGLALRHPERIGRLVLVATSGGIDLGGTSAAEWRDEYRREYPLAASWVTEQRPDYGDLLHDVHQPALLIWGDADPISPVAVGERLAALLPHSTLEVLAGGTHALAAEQPDAVADLIARHLG
jgi:pimeloyl-ACP methyl ester carboxylesterase